MAIYTINGISVCAGIGGIDLGIKRVVPSYRTVCHVEREAYAAAVLVKAMESGRLDQAPIWDDLGTFDGKPWRGIVDIVSAGLPCQPFSIAGKRKGDKDERYIWPEFFRILREVQPPLVFLENVPGIIAWFRPIGEELCRLGYEFEAGIFSAAEVGASHRRERFFCLAYSRCSERWQGIRCEIHRGQGADGSREAASGASQSGETLDNPASPRHDGEGEGSETMQGSGECLPCKGCKGVANFNNRQQSGGVSVFNEGRVLGNSDEMGCRETECGQAGLIRPFPPGPSDRESWQRILAVRPDLAPVLEDSPRRHTDRGQARGLKANKTGSPDVPQGRDEPDAGHTTTGQDSNGRQQETPQPPFRRVADGPSDILDGAMSNRVDRLIALGNAVVPLQAAYAFKTLAVAYNAYADEWEKNEQLREEIERLKENLEVKNH